MPDNFDLAAVRARQAAARAAATTELDEPDTTHLGAQAVAECPVCDSDGYTPARRICDHQPHSTPEARAAAREMLARALLRKPDGAA